MALSTGARLGSYEVIGALGAGGMGEVYRARDSKLGRDVAIKVLPELFAADAERLARFQREAQLLAALNHPNIAAIYGLEDAGATRFIVMELVEGESLDARLKARDPSKNGARGFSRAEALAIARQIVDAFEAAHDKGIIHRDLKPANVMLTEDGQVKVLDFGLAKLDAADSGASSGSGGPGGLTHSPTLTFAATQAGMILGTAAYMSPEQARGRPADKRSDVWAFGCVLYEMLAGRRVFDGDDVTDIIAAVVRAEPDWNALPPDTPTGVRKILEGCLHKDRKGRIPDMSVVRYLLADLAGVPPGHATSRVTLAGRRVGAVAFAAVTAAVTAAAIASVATRAWLRPVAPKSTPMRFAIPQPAGRPFGMGAPDRAVVLSPDGEHIVSVHGADLGGGGELLVRTLDRLDAVPLRGITTARAPFVSPDGRWIGFFDAGELKKVPISGGPPIAICAIVGGTRGSSWAPDDTIVFATNDPATGLQSVSAQGSEPKILTTPDLTHGEIDHLFPSFMPDGRTVLFTIVMSGALDNAQIAALDLTTGQRKILVRGGTHAEYAASGHLLYASSGALRAVRFDPTRLEVLSDPVVVVDDVRTEITGAAQFSTSRNGSIVYASGGGDVEGRRLVWVDRSGREEALDAPPRAYTYPRVSPDGARIAVAIADQDQDIWVLPGRQPLTRITFDRSQEQFPIWSPDGQRVLFSSTLGGIPTVISKRADGTGTAEQLTDGKAFAVPLSISADGKWLTVGLIGGTDIGVIRLDEQRREVVPLLTGPGTQANAEISPDGRWVAYQSSESGQFQIYVRPFPNVDSGRWQVSSSGGVKPIWSRNGQELFYDGARNGTLMAVPVRTSTTFSFETPVKLFDGSYYARTAGRTFDATPDGKRFLMIKGAPGGNESGTAANIVLVLNWFDDLRQRTAAR